MGEDPEGRLWIGADQGLARFDDERFIVEYSTMNRTIAPGRFDGVWVTDFAAVHRLRTGPLARALDGGIVTPAYPIVVYETLQGTLWIGTSSDGLCRFDDGTPTCFTTEDGLSSNTVRAIVEAAPDTLWLGTFGGGLCQFAGGAFTCLTKQHGLPDGTVHHILADDFGYVWLPSNKGIFRLDRADLVRFFAGETDRVFPDVYGHGDGMPSSECNGGFQPAGWKARDGRLWFPTTNGLAVVDPARVVADSTGHATPPVHIEQMTVDGTPQAPAAEPVLPAGSDRLTFQFTAPYLSAPEKLRFRYKIVDHDGDWIEAGSERQATYTNLPPGQHVFQVQAAVGNGPWSTPGAVQAFTLRPFFYQTGWFLGLCGFVVVVLTTIGYRVRIQRFRHRQRQLEALVAHRTQRLREEQQKTEAQARRLAELDEAKSRFFANISHEFRTPLTLIMGPLEEGLSTLDDPDALKRKEALMLRNTQRLVHLVNQLLDLAKVESGQMLLRLEAGELVAFLRTLVHTFMPLAERMDIALQFRAPADSVSFVFDRDALEKIVGNLLSNALKFTPRGGKVWVTLHTYKGARADRQVDEEEAGSSPGPDGVEIVIKDIGPGIPAEAVSKIFDRFQQVDDTTTRRHEGTGIGLALARELVELHGGEIFVESEPGFGSAFTVRLPLLADEGLEAGADDYLPKPFKAAELRARVARHIEARQQLRVQFSREIRVEPAGISVPAAEEAFLRHILDIVEARLGDAHFGAEALAEAVGLSPRQLRRRMRETLGESPAAFIRRLRLERAAQLLEARAGTVAEIAYRVGFNDPDYFSTAYRKHFGHPPTDTPSAQTDGFEPR